jgi:hypothetical protein
VPIHLADGTRIGQGLSHSLADGHKKLRPEKPDLTSLLSNL